jgi:hypothetical protein
MEVKMENRLLGPLQIHQESMQRLKSESSPHGNNKKKNDASTSRKVVDPILALRSIFTPRRTSSNMNNKADQSKMALAGRRGSTFMPEQESSDGVSSVSTTQMQQQKELEGLSDLDYDSESTPPSTAPASMSAQTHEWNSGHGLMGSGGGSSSRRRSRLSRRSRFGRKSNTIVNVDKEGSDSDSIAGLKKPNGEAKGDDLDMKQPPVQQGTPGRIREKLGKRRSSLFSVDEKRASIDQNDAGGVGGSGGGGSSCDNSITNEVMRRRSSIECRDGRSLICKFPSSRNTSPGYSGDEDTLICDWGRRQSNLSSSASSLSNPEEFANQHDKEKEASSRSLICGWDESEVSILSESTVSAADEKVLHDAVKACTLFDVRCRSKGERHERD